MSVLLDSDRVIDYLKGRPDAVALLQESLPGVLAMKA